jgi:hypothetical protein
MSWVIEEYVRQMPYIMENHNINAEDYNNCLLIQKCVQNLDKSGLLSEAEKDILSAVYMGFNYAEISRMLGVKRQTVSLVFDKITDRIAFVLGGEFSDAAFFDRVQSVDSSIGVKDISEIFRKEGIIKDDE